MSGRLEFDVYVDGNGNYFEFVKDTNRKLNGDLKFVGTYRGDTEMIQELCIRSTGRDVDSMKNALELICRD